MQTIEPKVVSEIAAVADHRISVFQPGNRDSETFVSVLTVIIPVFNEVKTIDEVLRRVLNEPTPKEVVIVDDGSTDGTRELLEKWDAEHQSHQTFRHIHRVRMLRHSKNCGKGAAIRTALEHARSEFVIVQDADLEVSPEEYSWLLKPLLAGDADIVVGFRAQDRKLRDRLIHVAGVELLNLAVRILYGVSLQDEACCFKVLRTSDLKRMNLECRGFEFCPEVVAKAARLGLRFCEIPVGYIPRDLSDGKKLRLFDGLKALATLWKYRHWREESQPESIEAISRPEK